METMFKGFTLGTLEMMNRFVFPPIKLAYGNPDGTVTDRQLVLSTNSQRRAGHSDTGTCLCYA